MATDRDTHFLGFGEHLYEALAQNVVNTQHKRFSELDKFKREQREIIAQHTYDLVHQLFSAYLSTPDKGIDALIHDLPDPTHPPVPRSDPPAS